VDCVTPALSAVPAWSYDLEDCSSGLELIRAIREDPALTHVPVMLVSNHADAQEAALDLGASPGFGKSNLYSDATLARISALLGQ
jgi:CheY-like chemotaxis protein